MYDGLAATRGDAVLPVLPAVPSVSNIRLPPERGCTALKGMDEDRTLCGDATKGTRAGGGGQETGGRSFECGDSVGSSARLCKVSDTLTFPQHFLGLQNNRQRFGGRGRGAQRDLARDGRDRRDLFVSAF
jgi:hypothetical protein